MLFPTRLAGVELPGLVDHEAPYENVPVVVQAEGHARRAFTRSPKSPCVIGLAVHNTEMLDAAGADAGGVNAVGTRSDFVVVIPAPTALLASLASDTTFQPIGEDDDSTRPSATAPGVGRALPSAAGTDLSRCVAGSA